jgi:hypothetical protein
VPRDGAVEDVVHAAADRGPWWAGHGESHSTGRRGWRPGK